MTTSPLIRFGKYLLLDKIATGGMAELYRAKITGSLGFERLIAIKKILPHLTADQDFVNSFIDEAKLAALLHHQNIVQIFDFGNIEDFYFIAMEYLFGKDLSLIRDKSKRKKLPLSLEHALYITSRICEGLDFAHNMKDFQGNPLNIIHRDISPPNILITYSGGIKIVDFGIAKAASRSNLTKVGMIKGKASYMSPEQAEGKTVDHRSDIFSTGILLYEMITNKRMFEGDTLEILSKVREAQFEPLEKVMSELPPKVYDILHRSLAKDPDRRYQSNGEMLSDLEECMHQNSFRPTARGLSQYMSELFEEEIAAEDQIMREAAQISATDQSEAAAAPLQGSDKKTMVMSTQEILGVPKRRRLWYKVLGLIAGVFIVAGLALLFREDPALTRFEMGMEELEKERFPEAAALFDEVLASKPAMRKKVSGPYAQALLGHAVALADKDAQKATSLLLKVVELDPGSVQGHFQLGLLYIRLEDYRSAIEAFQKVAKLDPQFSEAFFNLGYLYALVKDYSRAEEMYGRVVELAPPYLDEALFNLAIVQEKQGKRDRGIGNLERALTVNPNNEMAKKYLSRLKGKAGQGQ
jgi:serine/threonine protein kinase/thioredoxin-like negative regulator of GroEL